MPKLVAELAMLKCSMGSVASPMLLLSRKVHACANNAADTHDSMPNTNIAPFGQCSSQANPAVQAATKANQGKPATAACMPLVLMPWFDGAAKVTVVKLPALNDGSTALCAWAGKITVQDAGPEKVTVK